MNTRVYLTTHDPITIRVYDEIEVNELFGDDFLLDHGCNIPVELLEEYRQTLHAFWAVQNKLEKIYNSR
jgi:hypothetical protein